MMKKVIVLRGVKNSGKTTTLNMVIDLLLHRGLPEKEVPVCDERIAIGYNGKMVVVATYGDGLGFINGNINFLEYYCRNVDVFITATWSRGDTVSRVEEFANNHNAKLCIVDKTYCPENSFIVNKEDAERIIKLV